MALIVSRRIYKSLPVFSSYSFFLLIEVGVSYNFRGFSGLGNVFLALSFLDSAFMVAVLVELSMSALKPLGSSLPRWTPLVIVYMLALADVAIWHYARGLEAVAWATPSIAYTMCLDLCNSGLQIIFFIALAMVVRIAGIGWRSRELQITAGLGVFSFVNFWATVIQLHYGTINAAFLHEYHLMDELKSFGWCCLMLYWTVSMAREERECEPSRFLQDP